MSRNPFEVRPWTTGPHDPAYPPAPNSKKTVPDQKPVTVFSLFPNIERWAIGYDSTLDLFSKMAESKAASFPPYNISKDGDRYEITMALAGYKKDQISVKVNERELIVKSVIADATTDEDKELLHHGIAQRNFTSTFALGEYVQVKAAKLEDGLLTINLELELPEEKKPRVIEIN
jgi:molecular chaperone IbpA